MGKNSAHKLRQKKASGDATRGVATGTADSSAARKVILTTEASPVGAVLDTALQALDTIAKESHAHAQRLLGKSALSQDSYTHKEAILLKFAETEHDLFAAMSAEPYMVLREAVIVYGLQLLPAAEAIARRVGYALGSPALSSAECWEMAALLSTYYAAGSSTRLVGGFLDQLLRSPGPFLLGSPCFLPSGRWEEFLAVKDRALGRGYRKIIALTQMVLATGPSLAQETLQIVAQRVGHEIVELGMLSTTGESETSEAATTTTALSFVVPVAWHAACVQLIKGLLLLCKPIPPSLRAAAAALVQSVGARLHRGAFGAEKESNALQEKTRGTASPELFAAVVELRAVLHVLQHPTVAPLYTGEEVHIKRVKRARFVFDDDEKKAEESKAEEPKGNEKEEEEEPAQKKEANEEAVSSFNSHPPPAVVTREAAGGHGVATASTVGEASATKNEARQGAKSPLPAAMQIPSHTRPTTADVTVIEGGANSNGAQDPGAGRRQVVQPVSLYESHAEEASDEIPEIDLDD